MNHGERKEINAEDGSAYEVELVNVPNASASFAIVVNEAMKEKAIRLLPFAQKMAEARATRASFYRVSERSLGVCGGRVYAQAEEAAREARVRAEVLFMVAQGVSANDKRVVTVEAWREVMGCFHQDLSLGSVSEMRG